MYKRQVNTLFYNIYDANGSILESGPVITYKTKDAQNKTSVDYLALSNFASNSRVLRHPASVRRRNPLPLGDAGQIVCGWL